AGVPLGVRLVGTVMALALRSHVGTAGGGRPGRRYERGLVGSGVASAAAGPDSGAPRDTTSAMRAAAVQIWRGRCVLRSRSASRPQAASPASPLTTATVPGLSAAGFWECPNQGDRRSMPAAWTAM